MVLTHLVLAFRLQGADDLHGHVPDTYRLSHGVHALIEELFHYGLPYHSHLGILLNILIGKAGAGGELELAYCQQLGVSAHHCTRPVVVPVDNLPACVEHGAYCGDVSRIISEHVHIFQLKGLNIVAACRDAMVTHPRTHHHDEVGAHRRHLVVDALL